ncbi:hypothetical protein ACSBR2_038349 [Camellia fascicularis]
MTTETNSPATVPLGSTVAPPPVVPLGSTGAPPPIVPSGSIGASSPDATSPPFEDFDETQPPSETQNHVTSKIIIVQLCQLSIIIIFNLLIVILLSGTSRFTRVQGPTLRKGIQKIMRSNKGGKFYVHIDRVLNAMTGDYATPTANELGLQIRSMCPLKDVTSWLNMDETTKAIVIQAVLDKFDIGDDFHSDSQAQQIEEGVDDLYAHPPRGVSLDDWKHLIDVAWQYASHQKRSKASKSNRTQLPYNHTSGSRSFPIMMAAIVAKNVDLDFPKFYEDSHTSKKTNDWIHPKCGELHEELSRQVLGEKKKYLLGFGIGPQSSTIAASRARDKDMEAMRAEIEALRVEQQRDRKELIREREERKKYYNDMLREREERKKYYNDMLKEREERKRCYNEMLQQRAQG